MNAVINNPRNASDEDPSGIGVDKPDPSDPAIGSATLDSGGLSRSSLLTLAIVGIVLCLISPLLFVSLLADDVTTQAAARAREAAVGIGVILRATARRVIQFGARGAMRTAASTVMRAVARTLTRRLTRVVLHSAAGAASRHLLAGAVAKEEIVSHQKSILSLVIGVIGLGFSFIGSVYLASNASQASLSDQFGSSWMTMIALSSLPLLVYAALIHFAGRVHGATTRFATEVDGILLQGYFTGAGSFLPMLTDMVIYGTPKQRGQVAFTALSLLYACHLVLLLISTATGSPMALFASSMFLIYAFIYCFPIRPMEGHAIWHQSRPQWCLIFFPILGSFLFALPSSLLDII